MTITEKCNLYIKAENESDDTNIWHQDYLLMGCR
jgi:hypothetical protein